MEVDRIISLIGSIILFNIFVVVMINNYGTLSGEALEFMAITMTICIFSSFCFLFYGLLGIENE